MHHGRVMLIDDEVALVDILSRLLSPDHDVLGFTDAREALQHLTKDHDFDVIICDLMMPQLSSGELFAALHELAPELVDRVVFMTGGAFTPAAQEFLASVSNPRLQKPFEPAELTRLVQDMVSHRHVERRAPVAVA